MKRIYCDIAATTPLDPQVNDFMIEIQKTIFGNASSIHMEGQQAKAIIEKSRLQVSKALSCKSEEIIFTTGGSESNNMVLKSILNGGDHFITTSYEHPSIKNVIPYLENNGVQVTVINPNKDGLIDKSDIENNILKNTKLISVMFVNNELGTINSIKEIARLCKQNNILFHTDAVQAFGKINIDLDETPIDFLSISAHKLYGPKGIGVLFIREGNVMHPLVHGGSQEKKLRAGTENTPAIGGLGLASEITSSNIEKNILLIKKLEKKLLDNLSSANIIFSINGLNRIPGLLNLTFPGIEGQNLLLLLDIAGISISYGSACGSGSVSASKVLLNLGLSEEEAKSSVRISIGKTHTLNQIDVLSKNLINIISKKQHNTQIYAE